MVRDFPSARRFFSFFWTQLHCSLNPSSKRDHAFPPEPYSTDLFLLRLTEQGIEISLFLVGEPLRSFRPLPHPSSSCLILPLSTRL